MIGDRHEEPTELLVGPRVHISLARRLHDIARHAHTSGGATAEFADVDRVGERRAQHHAHDLDAPSSKLPVVGERFEPTRHVVPIELIDPNTADARADLTGGPLVLLAGLVGDVDLAGDPAIDNVGHAVAIGCKFASGSERGRRRLS